MWPFIKPTPVSSPRTLRRVTRCRGPRAGAELHTRERVLSWRANVERRSETEASRYGARPARDRAGRTRTLVPPLAHLTVRRRQVMLWTRRCTSQYFDVWSFSGLQPRGSRRAIHGFPCTHPWIQDRQVHHRGERVRILTRWIARATAPTRKPCAKAYGATSRLPPDLRSP